MAERTLSVLITGDPSSLQAALAAANGSMTKFERTLAARGRKISAAGSALTRGLTLPIVGVGIASVKASTDFEDSMSKINRLVGVSQKQVDAWSKDVIALGKELPQSPQELADAMFFITSAGLRGKDALDALEASAKAAAAGLGETETVADAVTSAINAYGQENLKAAEATDILVATVREGKADAASLAPVFGRVIPLAEAMGVSFDQVGAGLAALTRTGASADEAATQLSATIQTFAKPTGVTKDALDKLGTSVDEVRKDIKDRGLLAVLMDLRKEAEGAGVDFAEVIPNTRALRGALSLTGRSAEANSKIFATMAKEAGTTEDAFEKASKTAKFQFGVALSSVQAAAIQLGDAILPVVVPAVTSLGEAVGRAAENFKALSPETQRFVVIGAGIAAALGPALIVIGKLTTFAATFPSKMRGLQGALAAFASFRVAMLTLGAAIVVFGSHFDRLAATVGGFASAIGQIVSAIGTLLSPITSVLGHIAGLAGAFAKSEFAGRALQGILAGGLTIALITLARTAIASAVAGLASLIASLIMSGGVLATVTRAWQVFTASLAANPIGLLIVGVGALAGALGLFSGSERQATTTTQDLTAALDAQSDAYQRLKGFTDEAKNAKLASKEADLRVERAEQNLADAIERGGKKSLEAREATVALKRARQEAKSAAKEKNAVEKEGRSRVEEAAEADKKATRTSRSRVEGLREEIDGLRQTREFIANTSNDKEDLAKIDDLLRRKSRQLSDAIDGNRVAMKNASRTAEIVRDSYEDFGLKVRGSGVLVGETTNEVLGKLGADRISFSIPSGASVMGGGFGFNRGGMLPGFGGVDTVPAMLRPGEAVLTPETQQPVVETALRSTFGFGLDSLFAQTGGLTFRKGGVARAYAKGGTVTGDTDYVPQLHRALLSLSRASGRSIFVQSGRRTLGEQAALYAKYLAGTGNLAAPPNPNAPHVRGIAADITPGSAVFGGIAGRFGLGFPVPGEPWHIQLGASGGGGGSVRPPSIGKIRFGGPDPLGSGGQKATDAMRKAANSLLKKTAKTPEGNARLGRGGRLVSKRALLGRGGKGKKKGKGKGKVGPGKLSFEDRSTILDIALTEAEDTEKLDDDLRVLQKILGLNEGQAKKVQRQLDDLKLTASQKRGIRQELKQRGGEAAAKARELSKEERKEIGDLRKKFEKSGDGISKAEEKKLKDAEKEFSSLTKEEKAELRKEREKLRKRLERRGLSDRRSELLGELSSLTSTIASTGSQIASAQEQAGAGSEAETAAQEALAQAIASLDQSMREQNQLLRSELAVGMVEARRFLADLLSGEVGGKVVHASQTAGSGSVARF